MGHGIGAQKDMSLHNYASKFASDGMAVFVFDYRNYGGSDGQPRHWSSPKRHLQDWTAAYNYIQETGVGGKVDSSRIALWGTSFAGGHVLVMASRLGHNVSAVVSQMPHLSGIFATKHRLATKGVLPLLRLLAVGAHDKLRSLGGLGGAYISLVGRQGDLALLEVSNAEMDVYFSRHPPNRQGGWKSLVLARVLLELSRYNPLTAVPLVKAPVMLVAATRDTLCPPFLVKEAAAKLGERGVLVQRNCTHFGMYVAEHFQEVSAQMSTFLAQHLRVRGFKGAAPAPAAAAAAASTPAAAADADALLSAGAAGAAGVAAAASGGSDGGSGVAGRPEGGSGGSDDLRS